MGLVVSASQGMKTYPMRKGVIYTQTKYVAEKKSKRLMETLHFQKRLKSICSKILTTVAAIRVAKFASLTGGNPEVVFLDGYSGKTFRSIRKISQH